MNTLTQTLGLVLVAIAAALLWSPWALAIVGVLLMVTPEITAAARERKRRR